MTKNKNSFLKIIEKQRKEKVTEKFSGTFLDYLEVVTSDKGVTMLAHRRLNIIIESFGLQVIDESDPRCRKIFDSEKIRTYDYFSDLFFGMGLFFRNCLIMLSLILHCVFLFCVYFVKSETQRMCIFSLI